MDTTFWLLLCLLLALIFGIHRELTVRKLKKKVGELQEELAALSEMNEMLTENLSRKISKSENIAADFIRDLERLRTAIAGSGICEKMLRSKYKCELGTTMLRRIFEAYPSLSFPTKQRIADEILVGELGRLILAELNKGLGVEDVSVAVQAPLAVVKGQIRRLQLLGYLDSTLKPTASGKRVLSQPA